MPYMEDMLKIIILAQQCFFCLEDIWYDTIRIGNVKVENKLLLEDEYGKRLEYSYIGNNYVWLYGHWKSMDNSITGCQIIYVVTEIVETDEYYEVQVPSWQQPLDDFPEDDTTNSMTSSSSEEWDTCISEIEMF